MPAIADRLRSVSVSASAAMTQRARVLAFAGVDVISLSTGEPDFPTPDHATAAAHSAALGGDTKYPPIDGTVALKTAIQRKFRRDNGLDYPLDQIASAGGGKQIIFDAILATVDPGDEVVIPAPSWISYADIVRFASGVPVAVPCAAEAGFRPRPEDIDAAMTPRTKWLMLNFPNNPTGATCTADDLRAIADVMLRHPGAWILADDIYEHLVYDGEPFATIAAVEPRLFDRVLTVNGVSKAYAMTGWRIGYCGGPRDLIQAIGNVNAQNAGGTCTVAQAAAAAVLDGPQDLLRERAEIFRSRRDLVVERLSAVPGLTCHRPEGAFYVFPGIADLIGRTSRGGRRIDTDADFVAALLDEHHVTTVPGSAYGMSPFVRISYATSTEALERGCARIAEFCAGLR